MCDGDGVVSNIMSIWKFEHSKSQSLVGNGVDGRAAEMDPAVSCEPWHLGPKESAATFFLYAV